MLSNLIGKLYLSEAISAAYFLALGSMFLSPMQRICLRGGREKHVAILSPMEQICLHVLESKGKPRQVCPQGGKFVSKEADLPPWRQILGSAEAKLPVAAARQIYPHGGKSVSGGVIFVSPPGTQTPCEFCRNQILA